MPGWRGRALFALAFLLGLAAACRADTGRGLWLLPRKDAANTARCDVPGDMKRAPTEVWRIGEPPEVYGYIAPVTLDKKPAFFVQIRSGVSAVRPDGHRLWFLPKRGVGSVVEVADFDGDGAAEALVTLGQQGFALLDVATGKTRWSWETPSGAFVGTYQIRRAAGKTHLICFPQNLTQGLCLDLSAPGPGPRILWRRDYPNAYWTGFGPLAVLADMDNDGASDIVLAGKPGYTAVIDAQTGQIRAELHREIEGGDHIGRPYGLLTTADMDGDGYRDVVMVSCQVEEYISIVRNDRGKALVPLWSRFVEQDLPDDFREVRPNVTSVADTDGDGRAELVLGLFNVRDDSRWHTLVYDAAGPFEKPRRDLPGRYFWGCYDLDGDGRPEIVTSSESARKTAATTTLQAVDGRTGEDRAVLEGVGLVLSSGRIASPGTGFFSSRATPLYVAPTAERKGLVVRDAKGVESLWRLQADRSVKEPLRLGVTARMVFLSTGDERLWRAGPEIQLPPERLAIGASAPLVWERNGRRELVVARASGIVEGGVPDWRRPGKWKSRWSVPGDAPPALWAGAGGARRVVTLENGRIRLQTPDSSAAPVVIQPPHPVYGYAISRSNRTLLPFGEKEMRLYVGLQTGVHTLASALYDAAGKTLWVNEKEGPYPRTAAVADLAGEGKETIVLDNHGKILFLDLEGHERLVAHGWYNTVPGRSDGAKYAVPIIGPFGPQGALRIAMAPGLQNFEVMDASGARLVRTEFAHIYEFEWCGSAVSRRRDGGWDLGMINHDGVFFCVDLATGATRWNVDLAVKGMPMNLVTLDVDGDGRENFVVGLPNGDLVALDEAGGAGRVLWKLSFETGVREPIAADIDGDGIAELIVETDDGVVHILSGRGKR